jgi:hypothetical protein
MASEQNSAPSQGTQWLPTQQANEFALAMNGNELLLAFGQSRLSMIPTAVGSTPEHHVEWVATLSISPVAAAHLLEILQTNIAAYEKKFGKIPSDPSFKVTQSR